MWNIFISANASHVHLSVQADKRKHYHNHDMSSQAHVADEMTLNVV